MVLVSFFFIVRGIFIFYAEYDTLEKTLAIIFLLVECFFLLHAVGYLGDIFVLACQNKEENPPPPLESYPAVAILVPARHEPREVLEMTLMSLGNLDYPHKNIYLLDDSSDEKFKREADELAQSLKLKLFRREPRHGAKAGIVNDCLKDLQEKYIAIFDADQNPLSSFLSHLIPYLEADPALAFIQTPQFYSNIKNTRLTYAAQIQQAVFYEYICEGKGTSNSMICCGTNVIFRKEALVAIGGLDESTVTEDFATSFKLHHQGWRSIYYNHVYTFGMGPENIAAYLRQQYRWALGNVAVLRMIIKEFFKNPLALRPWQWFEYFITGSYYLISWAYVILIMTPFIYIFFNVPSFFMNPRLYFLSYVPYLALVLFIFCTCMTRRHYSFKQLIYGYLLFFVTIPIYMRASVLALLGVKGSFQVTTKGKEGRVPYYSLGYQLALWGIHLVALTWGINRLVYERTGAVICNVLWVGYHFFMFSSVFFFNEENYFDMEKCKRILEKIRIKYKIIIDPSCPMNLEAVDPAECWVISLQDKVQKGARILCQLTHSPLESVVFEGQVVHVRKSWFQGHQAAIYVTQMATADKMRMEECFCHD